jgi:cytochrome c oxidase cbb3-type subunit III
MKGTIALLSAPLCVAIALGSAAFVGARSTSTRDGSDNSFQSNVASGQQVYMQNCALCHGAEGQGKSGPRLAGRSLSLDKIEKQVTNGGIQMPSFGKRLSPAEVRAVSTYVQSLGAGS